MTLTLKHEYVGLPVALEYEPYDAREVEVLHMWVGTDPATRVDVWPALAPLVQREWEDICVEDLEERRAEERISRYEEER